MREEHYELEVGLVEGADIMTEDHGIITSVLRLDYGGSGQGAGMYGLGKYIKSKGRQVPNKPLIRDFNRVFKGIWGVGHNGMKGKYIRAIHTDSSVPAIGHLQRDQWLYYPDFFKNRKPTVWTLAGIWRDLKGQAESKVLYIDGVYWQDSGFLYSESKPEKVTDRMVKEARQ